MSSRQTTLGALTDRFSRDAIHMAVIPVTAREKMSPGTPVSVDSDGGGVAAPIKDAVGVVDPFLDAPVEVGCRFWLLLKPGTITGLRHDWSHPDFPNRTAAADAEREESEAWLRNEIGNPEAYGDTFEDVINSLLHGNGGTFYGREERSADSEFWFHLERFTGVSVNRDQYFDCRC